jgi:hypothetical protein
MWYKWSLTAKMLSVKRFCTRFLLATVSIQWHVFATEEHSRRFSTDGFGKGITLQRSTMFRGMNEIASESKMNLMLVCM